MMIFDVLKKMKYMSLQIILISNIITNYVCYLGNINYSCYIACIFLFFGYSYDRIYGAYYDEGDILGKTDRVAWIRKNIIYLLSVNLIVLCYIIHILIHYNFVRIELGIAISLALLYPIFLKKYIIKNIVLATCFCIVTYNIPIKIHNFEYNWIITMMVFINAFVVANFRDIADYHSDLLSNTKTIPVVFGMNKTLVLNSLLCVINMYNHYCMEKLNWIFLFGYPLWIISMFSKNYIKIMQ